MSIGVSIFLAFSLKAIKYFWHIFFSDYDKTIDKFKLLTVPDNFKGTVFRKNWARDYKMAQEEQLTNFIFQ